MTHFNQHEHIVRCDRFKESGKWYDTFELDMDDLYDEPLGPIPAVIKALQRTAKPQKDGSFWRPWTIGFWYTVLEPYHRNAYPVLIKADSPDSYPYSGGTMTLLEPEIDEVVQLDPGSCAHIVKTKPGENATAKVLEARVTGWPIEALCGYVWVPSKNPKQLPVCPKCKEIYEIYRMANGLNNLPSD